MSGRKRPKDTAAPELARLVEGVREYAEDMLKRHLPDADGYCAACSTDCDAWTEFPCDAAALAQRVLEVK